jgi:hypothetical protein
MSVSSSSTTTAGQARDDDVKECGDSTNDGLENTRYAVDNCHEASADSAEQACDLEN